MATRTKTIQFAVPTTTGVITDATLTALDQITVYIPETVIGFVSCTVDIGFRDIITATGGTITEHRVACRLGAAGYTTFTETDDITQSGENMGGLIGPIDFTAHFTTNWTGTSMTFDTSVFFDQNSGTTLGVNNVNAVLTITYTYDDDPGVNPTQIKTVWVPLESLVGSLATTANSNIGSNQIPQMTGGGGMLPEDSVVVRGYSFVIEGNVLATAVTDFTVSANIDSGTAYPFGYIEGALASDTYQRFTWSPAVPALGSAHNFQLWSSLAGMFNHASIMLLVTYEFDVAATTRVLNSILVPVELASPLGVTASAQASRFTRNIFVQEPGTITLKQSAFRINFNAAAPISGLNFRAGAQSFRAYTHTTAVACGMFCLQQRIDTGSGLTLARGLNSLTIDGYSTDTVDQVTNINGFVTLNYHSDKATEGLGAHSHTIMKHLSQWNAALADRDRYTGFSIAIPEAEYWIVGSGFIFYQWVATASQAVTFDVEVLSGESKGAGYLDIYADAMQTDAERNCSVVWMRGRDVFKRCPTDPDPDRLDIETARDYRLFTSTASSAGVMAVLTYHAFNYTTTISVTDSAGGSVSVDAFRNDTMERIATGSRTGNGDVDLIWHDDTLDCHVVAYEDATHLGRSANFVFGD